MKRTVFLLLTLLLIFTLASCKKEEFPTEIVNGGFELGTGDFSNKYFNDPYCSF